MSIKQVKIMRGLPGSGKSDWVDTHSYQWAHAPERKIDRIVWKAENLICSADHYHMIDGKYKFDQRMVRVTHKNCLYKFHALLHDEAPMIYVDNTNTTAHEIAPYYKLAELFNYEPEIIYVCTPFEICMERQTHNVPVQTMLRMNRNLHHDPLPDYWKISLVRGDK